MKKLLFLTGMIFCSCHFFAQFYQVMPASNTVADAAVSDTSGYVPYNNPAAIAFRQRMSAGFSAENKFLLKELMQNSLYLHFPLKYFHATINLMQSGFALYHEWMTGIHFSRSFLQKMSLGIQFNWFSFYSQFSDKYYNAFFPQIGLIYFPTEKWTLGFQVFNPLQTLIKQQEYTKYIPTVYQLGGSYNIHTSLVWRIQLSGELRSGYTLGSGFEYRFRPEIALKGGLIWGEFAVSDIGFSYLKNQLEFHLNTRIHPLLGLQPLSSIVYHF